MKKLVTAVTLGALLAGCSQIDTGNVGVESTFGQFKEKTLPPGLYMTLFKTIYEVTAKEHAIELDNMSPKAKDNVTLQDVDLSIYIRVNPEAAAKIMIRYAGDMVFDKTYDGYVLGNNLVKRIGREAVYRAFAQFGASEMHTKRVELASIIQKTIQEELDGDAGKGAFEITNIVIRNIVTDPRLEEAIKQSAEVEFAIRKKRQELELAKNEADRQKIEAEGLAQANKIVSDSLSPLLIELRRIESMNRFAQQGTHTIVLPSSGATPLVQVK